MGKDSTLYGASFSLIAVVLAGVLVDPYTLHLNAGDMVLPAPWWQALLGLVDLLLLTASLGMAWRWRYAPALALLAFETVWAIGSALILVHRDGAVRFIRGFGAEPYLTEYLIVMGLRLAAMGCLWQAARRASPAAANPVA